VRFVGLLRGVNVGGVRFAMADLRAALQEAGFADVRTVLASGNVLATADDDATGAARRVRTVVLERFGFDVGVVAVGLETVRAAVAAHPFPVDADRHAYVVFATDPADLRALADGFEGEGDDERVATGDGVLHWEVAKGRTLDSAFGRRLARGARAGTVTTRNRNTLEKILAAG